MSQIIALFAKIRRRLKIIHQNSAKYCIIMIYEYLKLYYITTYKVQTAGLKHEKIKTPGQVVNLNSKLLFAFFF